LIATAVLCSPPDVTWQGLAPGSYDKAADATANASLKVLDDPQCRPN
jgi:hypothetical protein